MGAAPGVAIFERIAVQWKRRQHELHAVQVQEGFPSCKQVCRPAGYTRCNAGICPAMPVVCVCAIRSGGASTSIAGIKPIVVVIYAFWICCPGRYLLG
jgi:hypothetical protein